MNNRKEKENKIDKMRKIMIKGIFKKIAVTTAAFATIVGLASTAVAQDGAGALGAPNVTGLPDQPIDANQNGHASIVITKLQLKADNGTVRGNGVENTNHGGTPLPGAKFRLLQVKSIDGQDLSNLDLTKNADWVKVQSLANGNEPKGNLTYKDENGILSNVTGNDGVAKFENLQFGLYRVEEIQTPAGASPISPFLVTLPMGNNNGYLYKVFAYPKNAVDFTTKTVKDDTLASNGEVEYTITRDIMPYQNGITKFTVFDALDHRLTYVGSEVSFVKDDANLAAPVENDDFVVTKEQGYIKLDFKKFDKLNALAKVGNKLVWKIKANLVTGGVITSLSNQAFDIPNQDPKWEITITPNPQDPNLPPTFTPKNPPADGGNVPGVPVDPHNPNVPTDPNLPPHRSNIVTTKFGKISVHKISGKDQSKLAGAKFELYTHDNKKVSFYNEQGILVDAVTTDAQGNATLSGIRLSDYIDGVKVTGDKIQKYKLVEVSAPDGYAKLNEPISVELLDNGTDVGVNLDLNVTNYENSIFNLPKTGSSVMLVFIILGVAMIGTGVAVKFTQRRKATQK